MTPQLMEMVVLLSAYLYREWELIVPFLLLSPLIALGAASYVRRCREWS